jgi:hypothetical protein
LASSTALFQSASPAYEALVIKRAMVSASAVYHVRKERFPYHVPTYLRLEKKT